MLQQYRQKASSLESLRLQSANEKLKRKNSMSILDLSLHTSAGQPFSQMPEVAASLLLKLPFFQQETTEEINEKQHIIIINKERERDTK